MCKPKRGPSSLVALKALLLASELAVRERDEFVLGLRELATTLVETARLRKYRITKIAAKPVRQVAASILAQDAIPCR